MGVEPVGGHAGGGRQLPRLQAIVEEEMEGAYSGRVKLTASSGVATNWLDAH